MRQVVLTMLGVAAVVSAVVLAFVYYQASQERLELSVDLQYRTQLLAEGLKESIEPSFAAYSTSTLQRIIERFANRERLVGLALYDSQAELLAASEGLPGELVGSLPLVSRAMDSNEPQGEFISAEGQDFYVFAEPLHQEERVTGAFVVVQSAGYIGESIVDVWQRNLVRLLVQVVIFSAATGALIWFFFLRPIRKFAESVKSTRLGERAAALSSGEHAFMSPLASEISKMSKSLLAARSSAAEEARMRLEKLDSPWTAERLQEFIKAHLKDRPIYVVSHIEPVIHTRAGREVRTSAPAGGVATAVSAFMEACGGTWVAYGAGDADRETGDPSGKLGVPLEEPRYTLKRVFLPEKDFKGYYLGFSNEALWPLSHIAHVRPVFRKEDWAAYRKVNGAFAKALLSEIKGVEHPLILVQDYQFALLPAFLKQARPDAEVAFFWHIPWPSAEVFSINPWRKEVLLGMLGADLIGFHTQQYCNNFIETVGKELEARIDLEHFSITHGAHVSSVKPFPVSIAFTGAETDSDTAGKGGNELKRLGVRGQLILGVDRMDYTKGILERLRGIEFLLDAHPEYRGAVTFLQIASPSRIGIGTYEEYGERVEKEAERINRKFRSGGWEPVRLERRQYSHEELQPLYQSASVCLVTSLHDGMNLVAKEYVAARNDEGGALVLSHFTGASRDLRKGALLVNPYSAEETAEALHRSLSMPKAEQHRRMKAMREAVKNYNVYRWAAELIKALTSVS